MTANAIKPKLLGKNAEPLTPAEQLKRFHDVVGSVAHSGLPKTKASKLGSDELAPEEQYSKSTGRTA